MILYACVLNTKINRYIYIHIHECILEVSHGTRKGKWMKGFMFFLTCMATVGGGNSYFIS